MVYRASLIYPKTMDIEKTCGNLPKGAIIHALFKGVLNAQIFTKCH
jgi:hypothetical protein